MSSQHNDLYNKNPHDTTDNPLVRASFVLFFLAMGLSMAGLAFMLPGLLFAPLVLPAVFKTLTTIALLTITIDMTMKNVVSACFSETSIFENLFSTENDSSASSFGKFVLEIASVIWHMAYALSVAFSAFMFSASVFTAVGVPFVASLVAGIVSAVGSFWGVSSYMGESSPLRALNAVVDLNMPVSVDEPPSPALSLKSSSSSSSLDSSWEPPTPTLLRFSQGQVEMQQMSSFVGTDNSSQPQRSPA